MSQVKGKQVRIEEDFPFNGNRATTLAAPLADTDAANKAYVDAVAQGLDIKGSCVAATTGPLPACTYNNGALGVGATLTGNVNGAIPAQDGVTLVQFDRLLVKDQVAAEENGIYEITQVGDGSNPFILTRTTDADSSTTVPPKVTYGLFTFIGGGTLQENTGWVLITDDPIVMGASPLVFTQFSGAGLITAGAGLIKTFNQLDVELDPTPGLEFDIPGVNGKLRAKVDPNGSINRVAAGLGVNPDPAGGLQTGPSGLAVKPDPNGALATTVAGLKAVAANASVDVSAAGLKAAIPSTLNKDQNPLVTVGDFQTTGLTIGATPAVGSYVMVTINGLEVRLGNGVKTKDAYFSNDGGVTARTYSAIVTGDTLYWNGIVAGFDLAVTDSVNMEYNLP